MLLKAYRTLLAGLLTLLLGACQSLPETNTAVPSYKLADTQGTWLASRARALLPKGRQESAAHPLSDGTDAFIARLALARMAEKTLDLQYYIWNRDHTGTLLAAELVRAADRGVRVRLLLDDVGAPVGDDRLHNLNAHPSIEVRLFNPLSSRRRALLAMASEFGRINRRMHNKSMTADNAMTIVGGRNIADEYFAASESLAFADLDLLAVGDIVDQVSDSFDLFWNYSGSWPIDTLKAAPVGDSYDERLEHMRTLPGGALGREFESRLRDAPESPPLAWYPGRARIVFDHPSKAEAAESGRLLDGLDGVVASASRELLVLSPYFVPRREGVEFFSKLVSRGVAVTVVTNSLAATDVMAVHSGYARYRRQLLEAGVKLYELRPYPLHLDERIPMSPDSSAASADTVRASLHAKAFFIDREVSFVGSLNLDPRSIDINTEVGIVFENTALASQATEQVLSELKTRAYELSLSDSGRVLWEALDDSGTVERFTVEPRTSAWQRLLVNLLRLLPIESQL